MLGEDKNNVGDLAPNVTNAKISSTVGTCTKKCTKKYLKAKCYRQDKCGCWNQNTWIELLALPCTSHVTWASYSSSLCLNFLT